MPPHVESLLRAAYRERDRNVTPKFVLDYATAGSGLRTRENAYSAFLRDWQRYLARTGLQGVSPHVMRHTFVTHALQNGHPPALVAQVVGDSVTTIMQTYSHEIPQATQGVLAVAADWFKGDLKAVR